MSVTNNINFIKPTQFKMVIDKEQYGNFNYFCTTFSLPSISATEVQTNFRGNQLSMPSEVIQYDPLNVRFLIDENFENYKEIFKWFQDNKGSDKPIVSDVTLIILSSHNNVTNKLKFVDAYPTSLSGVEFNTQDTTSEYLTTDVTLKYTYFEFV